MTLTAKPPKIPGASPAAARPPRLKISTGDGSGGGTFELGDAGQEPISIWDAAHRLGVDADRLAAPVFVSYASNDRQRFVEPLIKHLRDKGFTAWADWRDIATGSPFEAEIENGLHTCCAMLAVLTPASVDPGRWVRKEWESAVGTYFVPVLPLMVEDCEYPEIFEHLQYLKTAPTPECKGVAHFRGADLDELQQGIERLVIHDGCWVTDQTPAVGRVFVGRDKELEELVRKLTYGVRVGLTKKTNNAPVTVEGLPGMGKTMLVSELVRRIGPRYPGGVIFHSRTEGTEPQEVMRTWASHVIGKAPAHISPEDLRSLLTSAGRLLVVFDDVWLDDFENVRKLCVEALPPGTERILTTRHSSLKSKIGGEWLRLERLCLQDGIALLKDRFADSDPPPKPAAMERLWRILGGHALGLEVAAGQWRERSAFLEEQIDELEHEIRHGQLSSVAMSLRAMTRDDSVLFCFDLSLKEIQKADGRDGTNLADRFAQLGVLAEEAPFDQRTAAAIWRIEPKEARESLFALSRQGLVTSIRGTKTFKLHPLLHTYALGLLKERPSLLETAEARHMRHYVERLGEYEDKHWHQFEVHAPNVALAGDRAAVLLPERLVQALSRPVRAKAKASYDRAAAHRVMDLALAAAHYVWHRRVHLGRRWLEAGLAAARLLRNPTAQASLLTHLGVWHNGRGNRGDAQDFFEQALRIWQRLSGTDEGLNGLAWVLNNLGVLHRAIDEPEEAARYYREAIPIQETLGNRKGLSITLGCLGVLCRDLGRHDEAHRFYDQSLAIEEELGDLGGQSIVLNNIGRAHRDELKKEKKTALEVLGKALELAKQAGNRTGEAIILNNIGNVYFDLDQAEKALDYFRKTVPIREEILDRPRLAVSYHNIGEALRALGHSDEALEALDQALEVEESVEDFAGRAATFYAQAALLVEINPPEGRHEALSRLAAAREALEEKHLKRTAAEVTLARILELEADWRASRWTPLDPAPTI